MTAWSWEHHQPDDEGPGPRFRLADGHHHAGSSVRWLGLRRAWNMAWHLRALLAASTAALIVFEMIRPAGGPNRAPGPVLTVCILLAGLAFLATATLLAVLVLLGLVQAVTAWPLHDLDRWLGGLRWWAQLPVAVVLILFVSLPAIVVVVASIILTVRLAGLV